MLTRRVVARAAAAVVVLLVMFTGSAQFGAALGARGSHTSVGSSTTSHSPSSVLGTVTPTGLAERTTADWPALAVTLVLAVAAAVALAMTRLIAAHDRSRGADLGRAPPLG